MSFHQIAFSPPHASLTIVATYLEQSLAKLKEFEGCIPWMYRDTVGKVTVGVGLMLPDAKAAEALPFVVGTRPATPQEITAEFTRVDTMPLGRASAFYKSSAALELTQQTIDFRRKPCDVARFQHHRAFVQLAQRSEELVRKAFVERELGRELDQQRPKLVAQTGGLIQERLQQSSGVVQLGLVGNGLGNLHREAEVRRRTRRPALPRAPHVRAMKAGVDLHTVQHLRATLKVRTALSEVLRVLFRNGPAGGADAKGHFN